MIMIAQVINLHVLLYFNSEQIVKCCMKYLCYTDKSYSPLEVDSLEIVLQEQDKVGWKATGMRVAAVLSTHE